MHNCINVQNLYKNIDKSKKGDYTVINRTSNTATFWKGKSNMDDIKMRVSGVEKSFPGVKALSNIEFSVRRGTVHALCGENGAGGRSILMGRQLRLKTPFRRVSMESP